MSRTITLCVAVFSLLGCMTGQGRTSGASHLRLSFVIDENYDKSAVIAIFRGDDPTGLANRAMSMGVDLDLARRIHDAENVSAVRQITDRIVGERFEEKGASIQATRSFRSSRSNSRNSLTIGQVTWTTRTSRPRP